MTTFVQVAGCVGLDEGQVAPFVSHEDADFYGVYVGEGGDYVWQADFLHYEDALTYANAVVEAHGYVLDDKTYSNGVTNAIH
jgi:hypothetical protein